MPKFPHNSSNMEVTEKTPALLVHCSECKDEFEIEEAGFDPKIKHYCPKCEPLKVVKESWKPFSGSSSVKAVFVVNDLKDRDREPRRWSSLRS